MFVYGDSFTPFLVAIIRPQPEFVTSWASGKKVPQTFEELCQVYPLADFSNLAKSKELKEVIMNDLASIHKESKLNGFEAIKGVYLTHTEWTPDNNLTTPTLKIKRPQLKDHFMDQIYDLYEELGVTNLPGSKI